MSRNFSKERDELLTESKEIQAKALKNLQRNKQNIISLHGEPGFKLMISFLEVVKDNNLKVLRATRDKDLFLSAQAFYNVADGFIKQFTENLLQTPKK